MRPSTYLCILFLIIAMVEGLVLLGLWVKNTYASGVMVEIKNYSGHDMTNVRIHYTGGCVTHPCIKAGGSYSWKINPAADSHLELEFVDHASREQVRLLGCYIQRGYSGTIRIEVESDYDVCVIDEVLGPYEGLFVLAGIDPKSEPVISRATSPDEAKAIRPKE